MKWLRFRYFPRRPRRYAGRTTAHYVTTRIYEGYRRTAADLFTDRKEPLPPLRYHVFHYAWREQSFELALRGTPDDVPEEAQRLFVDPAAPAHCWFDGAAHTARPREDDREDPA